MEQSKDILFLFNPKSNEGSAQRNWNKARERFAFLPEKPVDITKVKDLAALINEKKPSVIAIAGGDGTINYVCNVVRNLSKKPLLTILPLGSGNALSYCFGVETMEKALYVLQNRPRSVAIDLMKTNVPGYEVAVFNVGVGFDARIVHNRVNYRYIGFFSYLVSAVASSIVHPEKEITFTIDHATTFKATASSLVIANCPIIGQNFVVAPDAKLNDGLFSCTLFSTKYAYLANLRLRGFKHPFYSEHGKTYFQAKHIRIEGEPFLQIDGDPDMLKEHLEVEILHNQITFLLNKKEYIDQAYSSFI